MEGMQVLLTPFVWILMLFYNLVSNYGVALLMFAVVVKLILFPFQLKGKRSMIQMTMISDKMQKIQKQYGKDKERYNLEVQKLYEKENVNPMSGCLWSFIPLLILLPLYAIVRQPLTYLMDIHQTLLPQIAAAVNWDQLAVNHGWINQDMVNKAIEAAQSAGAAYVSSFTNTAYNQLYLSSLITPENVQQVTAGLGEAGSKIFAINFDFLGLNLARVPQLKFWVNGLTWGSIGLFILPLISAASGFIFSKISMKTNAVNNQAAASNSTSKMMLIMSPLMSLWIGFAMPAALCVYWIAQNLLSMAQEYICGKMLKKDYEAAAARRAEQERLEKEEEKERKRQAAEERARRAEEARQNKGKKKAAPKKKDEDDDRIPGAVKEASRVGMRTYARGRAYDPKRFSEDGPTAYKEPGAPIDETAVEKALKKKSDKLEAVAREAAVDDEIVASLMEEQAGGAPDDDGEVETALTAAPDLETPEYAAPDYEAEAPYAEDEAKKD